MAGLQTRRLTEDDGIELIEEPVQQRLRLRVRRAVVAFLADLADGSRADRAAGAVAFNSLLNYPPNTVGARLKSIVTGIGEGQPWGDVDALLTDLTGRIKLEQLDADVQAAMDLITADVDTVGSVNARLAAEALERGQALLDEALARSAAIGDAVDALETTLVAAYEAGDEAVNSRVSTEVGLSQDRDTALGARVDTVTARLSSGGDIFSAIATALSYAYTKAATDTAIAASATSLTTSFQYADTNLNTRITNEAEASTGRDTALGTRVDTITARLDSGDIASSMASLATYAYTKAQSDAALSALGTTLRSEYNPINARLNAGGDIYTSLATANSYAYTKAQTDSALTSLSTNLTSSYTAADNVIKARLDSGDIANALANASTYAYTKAQVDSAIASSQTTLRSEFNPINARLNAGGDIYASLATANSYAYTKAQTDSAISSSQTTLRSEFNPINARLNAGGDIYTSLATANSYAYTKAQVDSAISSSQTTLRSEFNPINARLNVGGDIYTSLATANSYAYTKAQADSAVASMANTLRGEFGAVDSLISGSVSSLATVVAGTGGLTSQYALKTIATRSDGRQVFGYVGLSSTAPNSGSGGSELIIGVDRFLMVPSGDPNAAPTQMMEVGLVNGVNTLRIPAAVIGDLTVSTLKIAYGAVTVPTGAELASDVQINSMSWTTLLSVSLDTGGQPLIGLADMAAMNTGSSFIEAVNVALFVNGTSVRQWTLNEQGVVRNRSFVVYVASPGTGAVVIELKARCSVGGFTGIVLSNGSANWQGNGGTAIGVLGCKR